jgi:uncharacterized protein (TIGR02118 family)
MILVSVLYPDTQGSRFDHGYYKDRHIALLRERWSSHGLSDVKVLRGIGTADGGQAPYQVIALLTFASADALQKAVVAHGEEIFADIPRFTDVKPVVQVNEVVG